MNELPTSIRKKGKSYPHARSLKGQALLLVLLVLSVVLTVVLTVASRSVTDISTTTYEEDASRAFSAAEAGLEESLLTQQASSGDLPDQSRFDASFSQPAAGDSYNYPVPLSSGDAATFWFVSHTADYSLTCGGGSTCLTTSTIRSLCWGEPGTLNNQGTTPAIQLSVYYDLDQGGVNSGNFDSVTVARKTYDPHDTRHVNNHFVHAQGGSCPIGSKTYPFSVNNIRLTQDLDIPQACRNTRGCLLMARVKLLYNSTPQSVGLDVQAGGVNRLPAQAIQIESTGTAGESVRKLNVLQAYPEPSAVLDNALFSMNDLIK